MAPKRNFSKDLDFRQVDRRYLGAALLEHVAAHDVATSRTTDFGVIHEVVGRISSPDGRNPVVRVVWMIDIGFDQPRLITLVSGEEITV